MELDPQSETGKHLHSVLTKWSNHNTPDFSLDKIQRVVVGFSAEIENEDRFISLLYGQSVVDESPFILVRVKIFPFRPENSIITFKF